MDLVFGLVHKLGSKFKDLGQYSPSTKCMRVHLYVA